MTTTTPCATHSEVATWFPQNVQNNKVFQKKWDSKVSLFWFKKFLNLCTGFSKYDFSWTFEDPSSTWIYKCLVWKSNQSFNYISLWTFSSIYICVALYKLCNNPMRSSILSLSFSIFLSCEDEDLEDQADEFGNFKLGLVSWCF